MMGLFESINQLDVSNYLNTLMAFVFGDSIMQLQYLTISVFIDSSLGMRAARKEGVFSFGIAVDKIINKVIIYSSWVALFHAFDTVANLDNTAKTAVVLLLLSTEIMSAIKNTGRLGYGSLANSLERIYESLRPQPPKEDKEGTEKK